MNKISIFTKLSLLILLGLLISNLDYSLLPDANNSNAYNSIFGDDEGEEKDHDLTKLKIFNRAVFKIMERYVDPAMIDPEKMFYKALDYIELQAAPVLIDEDKEKQTMVVHVAGKSKTFKIKKFTRLYEITAVIHKVFSFLQENLPKDVSRANIEYAAINGMLSTLDDHSTFMPPSLYKEMKLGTKGSFGGLGIVISIRDGKLTVISPIENTPAFNVGIKAMDVITQIDQESTVNMSLNEAVSLLRGDPGTAVTIWVNRKGFDKPKAFEIERAIIKIKSVESKLLSNNIGYVKIKHFQEKTSTDLSKQLKALQADKPLSGLILDFRGNPGGLLDQAVLVCDKFIKRGTLVSMVEPSRRLDEDAHSWGTEDDYPIVALVDGGSASASEIVSGALKNTNRGIVIGAQTFGKGSVQQLFTDFPYESALKLTTAQYLTPGDISIQEVGITPDIALVPVHITKDEVTFEGAGDVLRESDLEKHFTNKGGSRPKPKALAHYLMDEEKEEDDDMPKNSRLPSKFKEDFPIRAASKLILTKKWKNRADLLENLDTILPSITNEENDRISKKLTEIGINWKSETAKINSKAKIDVKMVIVGNKNKLTAGVEEKIQVTVKNISKIPINRLRAVTESKNYILDHLEFVFGKLAPNEKKSWTTKVKIPMESLSRTDPVKLMLKSDTPLDKAEKTEYLQVVQHPRPVFGFSMIIDDSAPGGDGDGIFEPGEDIFIHVPIRNFGVGKSIKTYANLKNLVQSKMYIKKGRAELGELKKDESKVAKFKVKLSKEYSDKELSMKVFIYDSELADFIENKLTLPVNIENKGIVSKNEFYKLNSNKMISAFQSPILNSAPIAFINGNKAIYKSDMSKEGWIRLKPDKFPPFWVKKSKNTALVKKNKSKNAQKIEYNYSYIPPSIMIKQEKGVVVNKEEIVIEGEVNDSNGFKDLFILVNSNKVHYKYVGNDLSKKKVNFKAKVKLKEGQNSVTVVARENDELAARKGLYIFRK